MSDEKEKASKAQAKATAADQDAANAAPVINTAEPVRGEVLTTLQAQAPTIVLDSGQLRAQQAHAAMVEAQRLKLDTAPKGGRYNVNGQWVDADGKPIKE